MSKPAQLRVESSQARLEHTQVNNSTMAWNYDYEIRRKSTRRHRSNRHVDYDYAPSSYRNRYRGKQARWWYATMLTSACRSTLSNSLPRYILSDEHHDSAERH